MDDNLFAAARIVSSARVMLRSCNVRFKRNCYNIRMAVNSNKTSHSISSHRVVWTSFAVDLSDLILNVIVAVVSGSAVMLSQALQGAADLLTSGLLLVGIRKSRRRANRENRFGYGRELFFWVLMAGISTFILTATLSFYLGWQRFIHPTEIHSVSLALIILVVGLLSNIYAFSLSYRRLVGPNGSLGRWQQIMESNLIETKATLVLDLMGSVAAVLGLAALGFFALTGDLRLDGLGAMIVGVATGVLSILLIAEVKDLIVGRSATVEVEQLIKDTARKIDGVLAILDLKTMYLGSEKLLVNMEINLDPELTVPEIEHLTDQVKERVKRAVPLVGHIQVEVESLPLET